jgi:protocatechuate 3,4-dioxygenase beta subunit
MRKSSLLFLAAYVTSAALGAEQHESDKARITGMVVDGKGKPVPGVEVRVVDSKLEPVRSDERGRFVVPLEDYSALGERLVASDASGARMGMWEAAYDSKINEHTQLAEARVVLRPSVAIQVRVEDALRMPVPGAQVAAMHGHQIIVVAWTDDAGNAVLHIPDNTGLRHIFAMKPGAGFDYMENSDGTRMWPPPPPPAKVTLTLDGIRPVQVKAVGSDGRPVAGVEFVIGHLQKAGRRYIDIFMASDLAGLSRTTDANGIATFDHLPSSMTAASGHVASEGSYCAEEHVSWMFHAGNAQDAAEFTCRVMPKSSLRGKVCLPDGRPASGMIVGAQGHGYGSNGSSVRTLTRKDGSFAMRVGPESSYIVAVEESEWAARSLTGVVVKEGQARDDLQLQLIRGTLIRGTVTDVPGGKPVPGCRVSVIELGGKIDFAKLTGSKKPRHFREMRYGGTETDDAGQYAIRVGPGTYRIGTVAYDDNSPVMQVGDEAGKVLNLVDKSER